MDTLLSPDTLATRLDHDESITLLDIRNRSEIDNWRIEAASATRVEVPYMKFLAAGASGDPASLLPADATEPVVAVCARGEASDEVATMLRETGIDAVNLAGGMEGWGQVYCTTNCATESGILKQYRRPSSGCLAYLFVTGESALVIDPLRAFADRYGADAKEMGAELVAVVDTHVHADHISGLRTVTARGATPYMSSKAIDRGVTFDVESLAPGTAFTIGDTAIDVLASPGHTTGGISLAIDGYLVCGDTLFLDGVARPDLEADNNAQAFAYDLHRTVTERFADLPDDTVIAPGHYHDGAPQSSDGSYTARLGDLREQLWPFTSDSDTFVERAVSDLGPRPANDERIIRINLGREQINDEEAFELEIGPNNCAVAAD